MTRGGKREGAGRPVGSTGAYKEVTKKMFNERTVFAWDQMSVEAVASIDLDLFPHRISTADCLAVIV